MYQAHWGLRAMPFNGRLDANYFYPSPTHEEAIARLHYLVENRRRLGLLLAPTGSGKSLLLEVFARQLRRSGRAVSKTNLLGLDASELLWRIAVDLGLNPLPSESPNGLWRMLEDRLMEHRFRQVDTVILLDDVEQADRRLMPQLTRLVEHDSSPDARITVILSLEKSQASNLGNRLADLSDLRIDLEPWTLEDIEGFLSSSLSHAGATQTIFTEDAAAKLWELTGGIPRRVVQLADLALIAGAGAELAHIDAEVVHSVQHELGAVAA